MHNSLPAQTKKKIFIYSYPAPHWGPNDVLGVALAEDGVTLATHISSCEDWAQHDMGLNGSTWKHALYAAHFPQGYELVWIPYEDLDAHVEFQRAWELNQQLKKQHEKEQTNE